MIEIGPQHAGDAPFTARMRFHQSWYRAAVLGVPCGTGPLAHHKSFYGNMLRPEDGARGLNFLSRDIFEVVEQRLAEGKGVVEPFRCWHNMLSSQPMCFNLFGPPVTDRDLATRIFQRILPGEVEQVTNVKIEYAPEPASEYLDDRTAFDAFVEFTRPDGGRGFVGIETKLTEPFSLNHYDGPAYRRWVERRDSPWPRKEWPRLDEIDHNQLWRDHLLAVAMQHHPESPYASGFFMLVAHPDDEPCSVAVKTYRTLLKPEDRSFLDYPLARLVDVMGSAVQSSDQKTWLAEFKKRYLDLDLSENAWRSRTVAPGS